MWWRVERGGKLWEETKGPKARRSLAGRLRRNAIHAVMAYAGDEPVGWCSFGPRDSFPRLGRARSLRRDAPEGTWSIVCFFVRASWRRTGVATRLLAGATETAFSRGATEVEGFPAVPKTATMPAAFAWTGVPELFRAAGFRRARRPPDAARPIYVKRPR